MKQKKRKDMLFVDTPLVATPKKQHTVHSKTTFCAYIVWLHSDKSHKNATLAFGNRMEFG